MSLVEQVTSWLEATRLWSTPLHHVSLLDAARVTVGTLYFILYTRVTAELRAGADFILYTLYFTSS